VAVMVVTVVVVVVVVEAGCFSLFDSHVTANAAGYWNIHVKPSSGTSFTNLDHMVRLAISGSFGNWVIADCALGDKCSSDGCKKTV